MSRWSATRSTLAVLSGVLISTLCLGGGDLHGQEFPSDYHRLLRRLDATERRLQQLESQSQFQRLPPVAAGTRAMPVAAPASSVSDHSLSARVSRLENAWDAAAIADEEEGEYTPPEEPTFELGGRIHLDCWGFPESTPGIGFFENPDNGADPESRVLFRRIRLKFDGDIFETMLWRIQIDFNSPDSGEMKDVYIGFRELPYNQVLLFGNQKRPLGLDHLNSSRFNVFLERPLVVEAFNEDARRTGVCMYGYTDDELYHWRYGAYLLDNITNSGTYIGDSLQMSGNGRLSSSPWYDETSDGRGYFHWAIAGMVARPDGDVDADGDGEWIDSNSNEGFFRTRPEARSSRRWLDTTPVQGAQWYEILAFESILNVGPLQIVGEYQNAWMQRDATTVGTGPDLQFHGAYIYAAYFLTGEHVPYERTRGTIGRVRPFEQFFLVPTCDGRVGTGWGAWQVAARLSYLDLTDADILGGVERNVTLGLNWWWTSHSRLQFNAIYGDIEQHRPVGGFTSGNFWILGARFAADF